MLPCGVGSKLVANRHDFLKVLMPETDEKRFLSQSDLGTGPLFHSISLFGLAVKMAVSHLIKTLQSQQWKELILVSPKQVPPFLNEEIFLLDAEMLRFLDSALRQHDGENRP